MSSSKSGSTKTRSIKRERASIGGDSKSDDFTNVMEQLKEEIRLNDENMTLSHIKIIMMIITLLQADDVLGNDQRQSDGASSNAVNCECAIEKITERIMSNLENELNKSPSVEFPEYTCYCEIYKGCMFKFIEELQAKRLVEQVSYYSTDLSVSENFERKMNQVKCKTEIHVPLVNFERNLCNFINEHVKFEAESDCVCKSKNAAANGNRFSEIVCKIIQDKCCMRPVCEKDTVTSCNVNVNLKMEDENVCSPVKTERSQRSTQTCDTFVDKSIQCMGNSEFEQTCPLPDKTPKTGIIIDTGVSSTESSRHAEKQDVPECWTVTPKNTSENPVPPDPTMRSLSVKQSKHSITFTLN